MLPKNGRSIDRDLLFVGTSTNILAYDVERNADVFYKEVNDGVNVLMVGKINNTTPILISGGNCSLLGYDYDGNEVFWTVTGDNVTSLTQCDYNRDKKLELIVGSEDYEIRIFQNEEILQEISEADKIVVLKSLSNNNFAYGLSNGTVGVYNFTNGRIWRAKTKNQITSINVYDVTTNGIDELLIGWNNGTFQVRNSENGEILFKDKFSSLISGIIVTDYRMDGTNQILVCGESGEIRAYIPADAEALANITDLSYTNIASAEDSKAIQELQEKKLEINNELHTLERQLKAAKSNEPIVGGLAANTTINCQLLPDIANGYVAVRVEITPFDAIISNIIVIDLEGSILNSYEIFAITPNISKVAILPLKPYKHFACQIRLQTHLSSRGVNQQLFVFEQTLNIPKFASFYKFPVTSLNELKSSNGKINFNNTSYIEPISTVKFSFNETIARLYDYICSAFIVTESSQVIFIFFIFYIFLSFS